MSSYTDPIVTANYAEHLRQTGGTPTRSDERRRIVAAPFVYYVGAEGSADVVYIPAGFVTDLYSIPRPLWPIWPPTGLGESAAVVHDRLYSTQNRTRAQADRVFYEAMTVAGVPLPRRVLFWAAVRSAGWHRWRRRHPE